MDIKQLLLLNQNIINKYHFKNAKIEEIIKIKEFDEQLKLLLFKNNLFVERHLKSLLLYEYSLLYDKYDYLKINIYNKNSLGYDFKIT